MFHISRALLELNARLNGCQFSRCLTVLFAEESSSSKQFRRKRDIEEYSDEGYSLINRLLEGEKEIEWVNTGDPSPQCSRRIEQKRMKQRVQIPGTSFLSARTISTITLINFSLVPFHSFFKSSCVYLCKSVQHSSSSNLLSERPGSMEQFEMD